MPARISLRIDFEVGRRLGPGKVALLEAIHRTGSISGAGRDMKMAYRKAWLLVDEMNQMFSPPLVETQPGGRSGGGARLTRAGEEVVALYREAEDKVHRSAAAILARLDDALSKNPGPGESQAAP